MINKTKLRQIVKRTTALVLNKTGFVNRRLKKGGVIILMFHKVDDKNDPLPLTVTPSTFDQILLQLNKHHDVVALESLFDSDGQLVVDDQVKFAITFDDGYLDNYEKAFPVLQKHQTPATIYLSYGHLEGEYFFWYEKLTLGLQHTKHTTLDLTDMGAEIFALETVEEKNAAITELNFWLKQFTDKERLEKLNEILSRLEVNGTDELVSPMLSWDMVKEMQEGNVNFGSHTLSHPILAREDNQSIEREVVDSKRLLEEKTGQIMQGFAYPNGTVDDYNDIVLEYVGKADYQHACTTTTGINYAGQDPYQLLRINIDPSMCTNEKGEFLPDMFWAKVSALI